MEKIEIKYCFHGCGQVAKFYTEYNDTWRCSEYSSMCPQIKKKTSNRDYKKQFEGLSQEIKNKIRYGSSGMTRHNNSSINHRYTEEQLFTENSKIARSYIRRYLMTHPDFKHECVICHNTEWMGDPIPLVLDHINGVGNDNRLENLRFICPNCDHKTDTFCGRNKKTNKEVKTYPDEQIIELIKSGINNRQIILVLGANERMYPRINQLRKRLNIFHKHKKLEHVCPDCQKNIKIESKRCRSCSLKYRSRKFDVSKERLQYMLDTMTKTNIGKEFGVSARAITNRCEEFGIKRNKSY